MRSLGACALALGACFSPNYADRFPCGPPPNECPSGYACTNGQCGKNGGATIDAPIGPTADAPLQTGTLRVKVYALDGSIGAGITVAFHDPSGATVGVKTTDAAGEAQGQIVAGGGVTVGLYDASQRPSRLRTVRGVKPGQTITFGRPAIADALVQTAMVTLPGAAPAGTTGVSIEAGTDPCVVSIAGSAPPGPVPVPIRQHCVAGATYAVVAYAEDATHKRLGFSAMRGIPTGTAAVSLPPWQTTFATFQVNLSNAPAATMAPCVAADAGPVCGSARLDVLAGGVTFSPEPNRTKAFAIVAGGSTTVGFRFAMGFFDALRYQVGIPYGPTQQDGAGVLVRQIASVPANDPVDLGATLLPRVHNVTVDAGSSPFVLRFAADAPVTGADALGAQVGLSARIDGGPTNGPRWLLLAPPSEGSPVTFPRLPPELAPFVSPAFVVSDAAAFYLDFSTFAGYDDFVTQLGPALFDEGGFPSGPLTARATGIIGD
ncbi:MAG TPA: hypothetical protein VKE22_09165 [Haliangiales bacterium]|nr:hypothetical protein [Haliangiales bacterium]